MQVNPINRKICVGAHSVRPQTERLIRVFDSSQIDGRQQAHTVRPAPKNCIAALKVPSRKEEIKTAVCLRAKALKAVP